MKEIKNLILFLLLPIFFACSDRPSNVLSETEMVDLLVDMELTEAYANTQYSSSNEKHELGERVLEKHGVSKETLDTTLAWYGRNIDEYSTLFDKVDKKILDKKKKFMEESGGELRKESDNLWPYGRHLLISSLSGYDGLNFMLTNPELEKGEIIDFSFYLPNVESMKGTLGVEYKDGSGEAVVQNFSSKHKVDLQLYTDTAREVSKIFGSMSLKDSKSMPVYLDSISLKTEPYDSLNYRSKRRLLKTFGKNPIDR